MNFWWFLLVVIGILLFLFWLIRKSTLKKLNPNRNRVQPSVPTPQKPKNWEWLKILAIVLLVVWITIASVLEFIKMVSPKEKNYVSNVIKITDDTWIEFGPSYNKTYVLPEGIIFGFREASEPYCTLNKYLAEVCAEKGEDASGKLPPGSQGNLELKFKSSNGKICRLKIIIR